MFMFSHGPDSDSDSDPVDLWRSMLVETGGLTPEKADAIRAWFDDRPAFLVDADGEPIGDGPGHYAAMRTAAVPPASATTTPRVAQ